jgi:hypothetical protein
MNDSFPIAIVGELIGDQARSAMLVALLDGRARTAGELSLNAGISVLRGALIQGYNIILIQG